MLCTLCQNNYIQSPLYLCVYCDEKVGYFRFAYSNSVLTIRYDTEENMYIVKYKEVVRTIAKELVDNLKTVLILDDTTEVIFILFCYDYLL